MMGVYLEFLARMSMVWLALILFYLIAWSRNDNWKLKRQYLLGAYLLGWLIPLIPSLSFMSTASALPIQTLSVSIYEFTEANENIARPQNQGIAVVTLLLMVYTAGIIWNSYLLIRQYLQLLHWKKTGQREVYNKHTIIRHAAIRSPFAAIGSIFLPGESDLEGEAMICKHEEVHLSKLHNLERMPLVLGQLLLWFHPLQYVFQYLQQLIQEYEADAAVIGQFSISNYGKLLIQTSMYRFNTWRPGFISSPLKKRIAMMCKPKKVSGWRNSHIAGLVLLLAFLMINCSDLTNEVGVLDKKVTQLSEVDQAPILQILNPAPADEPEKYLFREIAMNIKYPLAARQTNTEGAFRAAFTVTKEGKLEDLEVTRGSGPGEIVIVGYQPEASETSELNRQSSDRETLEESQTAEKVIIEEIQRIYEQLPDWEPAKIDGEAVDVRMEVFLRFKLQAPAE